MAERPDHVFATDLPKDTTEDVLRIVFGQYGTVQWCRLFNGMGKTAALLQFASPDEASFLVENMNGTVLHDLLPTPVTLAYSEGRRKGAGKSKGGFARSSPYGAATHMPTLEQPTAKGKGKGASIVEFKKELQMEGALPGGRWTNDDGALHVGGMPLDTTDKDVYEIFASFGSIAPRGVKAMMNPDGTCTGVAFVNYIDPNCAQAAVNALNGRALKDGRIIHVKPKRR